MEHVTFTQEFKSLFNKVKDTFLFCTSDLHEKLLSDQLSTYYSAPEISRS